VLVLASAEPTLAPAVQLASAVVCECGGSLSYLSTLARVWGIPLVVGADNCTRAVATGERLKVDGVSGRVIVLAPEPASAAVSVEVRGEAVNRDAKKDPGGRGIGEGGSTAGVLGSK